MKPSRRSPSHPGEILRHEFREPLGLTQEQVADGLDVSYKTVNAIECGRQSITPEMALRLARCLKTTPDLWLNLQHTYDVWQVEHGRLASAISKLKPLRMALHR